ncbi:MAG: hypothetical protein NC489_08175 [Ruminococcus flavefaciens]|nr:hypothetical protein [Ruminococcus flavefaciens]
MSDLPNKIDRKRNLPSTYQEVLRHGVLLDDEIMPIINLLKNTILKPGDDDGDSRSDVIIDDDGNMKVVGVTVVLKDIDKDLKPSEYLRDVTYELKNAAVIGLAGKPGVSLRYVTLKTVNVHNKPDGVVYPAWQCAYGDQGMEMWYRKALSDGEWGPWERVVDIERLFSEHPEIVERFSHRQVLESKTLPENQDVGDYWFWPIVKGVDPLGGGGTEPPVVDPDPPIIPDDPDAKTGYILQSVEDPSEVLEITQNVASTFRFIPMPDGTLVEPGSLKSFILTTPTD